MYYLVHNRLLLGYLVTRIKIGVIFALFYIISYANIKNVMVGHGEMIKQEHISKKIWYKPELRVLCRGESEENVLITCKSWKEIAGPNGNQQCRDWGGGQCRDSASS